MEEKIMCECGNFYYLSDDKETKVNNITWKETWTCEGCGQYFQKVVIDE